MTMFVLSKLELRDSPTMLAVPSIFKRSAKMHGRHDNRAKESDNLVVQKGGSVNASRSIKSGR